MASNSEQSRENDTTGRGELNCGPTKAREEEGMAARVTPLDAVELTVETVEGFEYIGPPTP